MKRVTLFALLLFLCNLIFADPGPAVLVAPAMNSTVFQTGFALQFSWLPGSGDIPDGYSFYIASPQTGNVLTSTQFVFAYDGSYNYQHGAWPEELSGATITWKVVPFILDENYNPVEFNPNNYPLWSFRLAQLPYQIYPAYGESNVPVTGAKFIWSVGDYENYQGFGDPSVEIYLSTRAYYENNGFLSLSPIYSGTGLIDPLHPEQRYCLAPDLQSNQEYAWGFNPHMTSTPYMGWGSFFSTGQNSITTGVPEPIIPPVGVSISGVDFSLTGGTETSLSYCTTYTSELSMTLLNPGLNNTNSYAVILSQSDGTADVNISVPAGIWWIAGWWNNAWHTGIPYPCNGPGTVTLAGIPFGVKGEVPVVISLGDGNDPTLPVELSSFDAVLSSENYVSLTWVTQTETQVLGYNVYRGDMENLDQALKVNLNIIPAVNSSQTTTYQFVDSEVEITTYYYWLENVDMDGITHMFGPISITVTGNGGELPPPPEAELRNHISVFPNPASNNASISAFVKAGELGKISICNIKGQELRSFDVKPGYNSLNWKCDDCASGIYFYKLVTNKGTIAKKLILLK